MMPYCPVHVQARQLSVEQDMKPVVDSLQKHGLSQRDICKVWAFLGVSIHVIQCCSTTVPMDVQTGKQLPHKGNMNTLHLMT